MAAPTDVWGVDLYAAHGEFGVPAAVWRDVLRLALAHGWVPLGPAPATGVQTASLGVVFQEAQGLGLIQPTSEYAVSARAPQGEIWPVRVWRSTVHGNAGGVGKAAPECLPPGGERRERPRSTALAGDGCVLDRDAQAIALALWRALPAVPDGVYARRHESRGGVGPLVKG
jgi:hypothetical protein